MSVCFIWSRGVHNHCSWGFNVHRESTGTLISFDYRADHHRQLRGVDGRCKVYQNSWVIYKHIVTSVVSPEEQDKGFCHFNIRKKKKRNEIRI